MQHVSHILFSTSANSTRKVFPTIPSSRAEAIEPEDNGTFILPMKQSFMKNRRIMDSTARMLAMLAGWAGHGQALETTQGIVARHIGKSVRTVQRMLLDAWREGYLTYAYTKNRRGMITGIRVFLRLQRILKEKKPVVSARKRRNPGATPVADTNRNIDIKREKDPEIMARLERFAQSAGLAIPI
ncbi:MAG: hypothetical protein KJO21_03935 [Verrucomicrobiae bacterium]|nr:hypothetical protein [Verrucomicrobiae bacterium]NNJ42649.1 hypothetical protein [Akkermansiaceae bacterium]